MKRLLSTKRSKIIIPIALVVILAVSAALIITLKRSGGSDAVSEPLPLDVIGGIEAEYEFSPQAAQPEGNAAVAQLSVSEALDGQTPRDGFTLAPTIYGLTGIDPISSFVLRVPSGYDDSAPPVSIDGQPQPEIKREDSDTFVVTPAIPLTSNSVFTFRIARDSGDDLTWAFQTAAKFEIKSTLPRNQSTNVPVQTGIEITFSQGDSPDIADYFSIYPDAEGRFISRGSTAIFMPTDPLDYAQIYTVTIGAGLSLPGTSDPLSSDYVFQFETAPEQDASASRNRESSIYFNERHVQFPSFAPPSVSYWFNYNRDGYRPAIDMQLHRIDDREQAIAAVDRLAGAPRWSAIYLADRLVDTTNLTRVYATTIRAKQDDQWYWNETLTLPNSLAPGFYVLSATSGGATEQMIIQITDLAVQMIADSDKTLVWVNDMTTGLPAFGASLYDPVSGKTYTVPDHGLAVVERAMSEGEHLVITAADGKEIAVFAHPSEFQQFYRRWWDYDTPYYSASESLGSWYYPQPVSDLYWTALQLDRTLFNRSDKLSLWGFVQNRRQQENIRHVTAVLTERSWWGSEAPDALHRQNIPVVEGAYSGEISLPNIDPGYYELTIYHGDVVLSSIYFNVMDYVKPPYQLNVSADKTAIFAGEEVTFAAKTEFFEGTPVPDLDISYSFWGWGLNSPDGGQRQTDLEGALALTAAPTAERTTQENRVQGERGLSFNVEATLPETGWVFKQASVRVFVNDINVRPKASREGADARIEVEVNSITLDRLNDGTAEHWGDYIGAPKAGQVISVALFEYYWEAVRDGELYDHVTRQVVPKYRYVQRTNTLRGFEMTTGPDGAAARDFTVPNRENASYVARLSTIDGNGRTIWHDVYIGRDYTSFFYGASDDYPFLYGADPEGYDIGDEVELTIMRGAEPVAQGNFLFVVVQDGVMSYHIGKNSLSFVFGEQHVPNVQVFAYHFNGHTYHTSGNMAQRLRYNPVNRSLSIDVTANQEAYKPGDIATFTVTTTDQDGNPKAASVNISMVDEALFALMDYSVDTLASLYGNVSDSLKFSLATHRTFISGGIEEDTRDGAATGAEAGAAPAPSAAPEAAMGDADESEGEARIRERFEDTAVFRSLHTDEQGQATFSFMLPDNITSWRATASAISDDLYAGNTLRTVRVTQPMFLHYTLGSVFLVGDAPYVGVNAYGTSLTGGEQVTFEVWREERPDDIRTATGLSFERVNIPLWEMSSEGIGSIVIQAKTSNGYSDAVRHTYQALSSYRQVDTAVYTDVTADTVFDANSGGLTNITFTDKGRGRFLHELLGLRNIWRTGARVEGLIAKREATRLIRANFPEVELYGEDGGFDLSEYQTDSGGIAILPYADADIQTTVMLMPFVLDDVNQVALRGYLWNVYKGPYEDDRMLALYGLAMLGEPVLLDLREYAAQSGLGARNAAYVGLGLTALGEMQPARDLYGRSIEPHVQHIAPYYRIGAGSNRAEILDATSVAALLAAALGIPESEGLHDYAMNYRNDAPNRFNDDALLLNIERLAFISHQINKYSDAAASITYSLFGETVRRELGRGRQFTLRIPAASMGEFELISTTGEVGAVSIVRVPLEDMEAVDNDITIRREYFRGDTEVRATTFAQDELIRVQITVGYSAVSMSGSYMVTDFLPSGLVHVANSARFESRSNSSGWWAYATTEGQRITFYDYNGRFDHAHTYYYYARVINPGTFKAEGTLVQSVGASEYMTVGAEAQIMIT